MFREGLERGGASARLGRGEVAPAGAARLGAFAGAARMKPSRAMERFRQSGLPDLRDGALSRVTVKLPVMFIAADDDA